MLKRVVSLALALMLSAPLGAFAGAGGSSTPANTTTTSSTTSTSHSTSTSTSQSTSTSYSNSTSTSHSTSDIYTNVGNIDLGYQIHGFALNTMHPDWDGNYYYTESANYSSTLELLLQGHPDSYSASGSYWQATHPAHEFVAEGGRGAVYNEGPVTYAGSSYTALSARRDTGNQTVSQSSSTTMNRATVTTSTSHQNTTQDSQTVSTSTSEIKVGDVVLAINTNTNTNTNTNYNDNTNTNYNTNYNYNTNVNTNYNEVYQTIQGTGVFDYYSVNSTCWVSPIVLDLSHTGKLDASEGNWLPHTGIKGNKVLMFDINGNGLKMMMEWVGPNAGLLIEPKADGTVDGSCMFGTAGGFNNGYQKLGLRDKNNDGQLTGAELNGLLVWQDKNQNGTIDKGELKNLSELKISQLSLKQNKFKSSFVMNGKTETMWDWWPTALDVRKVAVFNKK